MSREMKDSGVEWIGEIPEDWDIQRGKFIFQKLSRSVQDNDEVITCFRDGEVTLRKNRREEGFTFSDKEIGYQGIEPGDLVVHGMDGFAGSIGISDSRGKATPVLNVLDTKYSKLYYMYYLRSMAYGDVFTAIATGIRVRSCNLNWNKLGELSYPVPSANEQKDIANYIKTKCTAIDTAIEKTKKSIEKLEEYKKAVITKAVTKGIDPNAKMKDSGVEWIGEIPEGWKVKKTKYLFRILKRIAGREGFDVISITQKGLKIKDITSNEGQVAENYSNYQFVFPGDFAMNHMDLLTGWVDLSTLTGVTSPDYRVFHKINESVNDDYYKYVFQSLYFNKVYYGLAQGVAEVGRKRLQAPAFKELKLPCPPSDKPAKIAAYIKDKCMAIDALIEKKQTAINKWEEYKKSLIYYAITGKIDCRNEVI